MNLIVAVRNSILALLLAEAASAAPKEFASATAPTKSEWQYFHKMTGTKLTELWNFQAKRGSNTVGSWAWQWRLGWVKQCTIHSMPQICPQILKEALKDDAMVVRAEAATALGKMNRGKPNEQVIRELADAYRDTRNMRNGTPLFVCDRILEALHNIGGQTSLTTASRLAKRHPATSKYWSLLSRSKDPSSLVIGNK